MSEKECIFCYKLVESHHIPSTRLSIVKCDVCGDYSISYDYVDKFDTDVLAFYLFYKNNLFSPSEENNYFFSFIGSKETFDILHEKNKYSRLITLEEIENWYPKSFSEKIDYILLGIDKLTSYSGEKLLVMDQNFTYSLFFIKRFSNKKILSHAETTNQIDYVLTYLKEQQYIKQESSFITLLPNGLKRIDELQKNYSNSKQVFIAIAFSKEMEKVQKAIEEGIRKAGYIPYVMNRNKHNNQIVPEILYQIKQSKFMVAEFTASNNGAYYEAGYAAGLGKEVIHICNKGKFNKEGHFDIKQKSTILWENEEDIANELSEHIKATIV